MLSKPILSALAGTGCEVRADALTRQLYGTDASLYQIEPLAVAFPKTSADAAAVIRAAAEAGIPVTPRGAGTGLAGGAVGDGLIVDLARHSRRISDLDVDQGTVRVGAGVVLDQLNDFLKPHGVCFGPDVATSSRATLGGMINNNSSGARAPIYGTTADHVVSAEVVLADGRIAVFGGGRDACTAGCLKEEAAAIDRVIAGHEQAILERFPHVLVKRWPGYGLDQYLRARGDLSKVLAGSEGTLVAVTSAVLKVVPMPREKGLCVIFFASVAEAMQATVELLDLRPAAIEHCDRTLFDQTKGQLAFQAARDLLQLDAKPCEAFLIVEFYDDDVADRLATVVGRNLGLRTSVFATPAEMLRVWGLRKSGLSLLTGRKGAAKPVAGIEDVAVRPERLPEYIAGLRALAAPLGLETSFYGHCASGLVHVRPVIDMHRVDSIAKFRSLAEGVSALTRQFGGSLSGEHGVGIARTEFMDDHIGPELLGAMRQIKDILDPRGVMNPGKIFPGRFHIDGNLRMGDGYAIPIPFAPVLKFCAKDESFVANLEQCNGCGECRKDAPTMCPTFLATGDEYMSTRGRANAIRAVLEGRMESGLHPLASGALDAAIGNCLSCKACKKECPSNVDMALLKAELLHARHAERGVDLLERVVSRFDLLGRLGTAAPRMMNSLLQSGLARGAMEKIIGLAAKRPLPLYTTERFDAWFAHRPVKRGSRGPVILWDDCSVRYFEPQIGMAAVAVLESAGYEVVLPQGAACCGRPAFSVGRLDVAKRFGSRNVARMAEQHDLAPIVFLEPSCYSMFAQDYAELGIDNAATVAGRCILFEDFVYNLLDCDPDVLAFADAENPVAIHAHCHAKALTDAARAASLAARIPGSEATMMDTGCCGMAGSFGALRAKYDLSVEVARPLVAQVQALAEGTTVVASGTSCRQQIAHLTRAKPVHMAELLAQALRPRQ